MESTMLRRDLSEFCEQLGDMQQRFSKMDNCERTIALYYLTIGLPFANARFLQRALEQAISKVSNSESQNLESNANDPTYVNGFLKDSAPVALSKMLCHLPLLRPGNKDALRCYNMALRQILTDELLPNFKIYNECIEILSYVFVHPAFSREDKKFFKQLLNCVSNPNYASTTSTSTEASTEASTESITKQVEEYFQNCPPPKKESTGSLTPGRKTHIKQDKSSSLSTKPRSFSFSTEQPLQFISTSIQSSSSETRLQDLELQNSIIMKGVIGWLKSLRLHKYSWLFNNVTYEQMLNFTEDSLEALGITKGARNKLILNIAKLKERKDNLVELENEVLDGGDMSGALKKLKILSQTPLETSFADEDLPSQFVRVMGKVCTQMVVARQLSDEYIAMFTDICDRCEQSDAFTEEQKKRLRLWRGHLIQSTQAPSLYQHQQQLSSNNVYKNHNHKYYGSKGTISSLNQGYSHKSSSYPNMRASPVVGAHRHSLGSATLQNQLSGLNKQFYGTPITSGNNKNAMLNSFNLVNGFSNGKDKDVGGSNFITAEKFYVHKSSALKNTDIESSLESLCLQMMEHALGP